MKLLTIILFVFLSMLSHAKVWETTPGLNWDAYWDQKFQQWIKNDVGGDFFKELGNGYQDLPLDCADAMYAFKIYFSYQHKLPWRSNAHTWQKGKSYPNGFSNEMTDWDELTTETERVIALITFLIDRVGTESLANLDTFSVPLHDVRPGDLYMYKYGSDGSYTRHTYIIKEVNVNGTFDVLYGTQLRAKKLWGLGRTGAEYLQHKPDRENWGFKRVKSNLDIATKQTKIIGAHQEQYEVAKRLTEQQFFDYANVSSRIIEEGPTDKSVRLLQTLCRSLNARNIVVKDAVEWQLENTQCMNESTYDAYSTPSRDMGISKQYEQLDFFYKQLEAADLKRKVNSKFRTIAESIFADNISQEDIVVLENFCKIEVSDGIDTHNVNLRSFYQSLENETASFHPNDNFFQRWGIDVGQRTNCHAFYGKKKEGEEDTSGTQEEDQDDSTRKKKKPNLFDILFGRNKN